MKLTTAESLLIAGLLLAFASPAPAQDDVVRTADVAVRGLWPSDFPRIKKLADNVYVYEGLQNAPPRDGVFTTNSFIVITSEGVLLVDGQDNPENVKGLLDHVAKLTSQPVKYMIVGSDHSDHSGGNTALPPGVTIIAHPNSKAHLEKFDKDLRDQNQKSWVVMPTEVMTSDKKVIHMGGEEIDVLFLGRAHTGGDLEVYLPRENIVFMSEAFFNRLYPSTYNGYPSEWIATLRKAEALNAAMYVPGHGFVDRPPVLREELTNFRLALENLVSEGKRMHDSKIPIENTARLARLGSFQYWTRCANNLPDGLKRVYMELDGQLK